MSVSQFVVTVLLLASGWTAAQDIPEIPSPESRLYAIEAQSASGLRELFHYRGGPLPFVAAHRGGPRSGFPENCIATFENTLRHTFATLEIDPRYAGDGSSVVHHDPTLERTTTGTGPWTR